MKQNVLQEIDKLIESKNMNQAQKELAKLGA